ncbi:MAG: hypothetical protein ISS36_03465 [Candidatus Aenigmarchaeota archaeon]|nr:hypothetical protein [Candidatus Aenigmarchaeota archaeon]
MIIMICGSMSFAKEMMEAKKKLESMGHEALLPCDIDLHLEDSEFIDDLDKDFEHCIENQVMETCFGFIEKSDAIVVLNHPKNDIDGYIGTSTMMEIGLARYLNKKIFILNNLPDYKDHRWVHEVRIMQPVMLEGDLNKITL